MGFSGDSRRQLSESIRPFGYVESFSTLPQLALENAAPMSVCSRESLWGWALSASSESAMLPGVCGEDEATLAEVGRVWPIFLSSLCLSSTNDFDLSCQCKSKRQSSFLGCPISPLSTGPLICVRVLGRAAPMGVCACPNTKHPTSAEILCRGLNTLPGPYPAELRPQRTVSPAYLAAPNKGGDTGRRRRMSVRVFV